MTDHQGVERLRGVSMQARGGEILGVAGVAGNGQSELLEVLAGIKAATGTVRVAGQQIDLSKDVNGQSRRQIGVAHVPEDRHRRGLIMDFTEWENSIFGYHQYPEYSGRFGLADQDAIRKSAAQSIEKYDIRPPNCWLRAESFSGGNQQKIVIAHEMERTPGVLLIGQPTRGVDIGAIEFIHRQIVALRDAGKTVLLVSVELEEILSLSDRVVVMFDGAISGERVTAETNEKELGLLMARMNTDMTGAA